VTKIILIIVLVAIAIAWFRARSRQAGARPAQPKAQATQPLGERMVTCGQCGLNLPAGEAVFDAAGAAFCGTAHLDAQRARERR